MSREGLGGCKPRMWEVTLTRSLACIIRFAFNEEGHGETSRDEGGFRQCYGQLGIHSLSTRIWAAARSYAREVISVKAVITLNYSLR